MKLFKVSAFSIEGRGGNPAGVVLADKFPEDQEMLALAVEVNYSEIVFAVKQSQGWRVRYFSPKMEVLFCGHATIALGAILAAQFGSGEFSLMLNEMVIPVQGLCQSDTMSASFQSAPASHSSVDPELLQRAYALFGFQNQDIDFRIPPQCIFAGAHHLVLALKSRSCLAEMSYDFTKGRDLLQAASLTTLMLVFAESDKEFHVRNIFPNGGIYEDPATGSAAAAFAGYIQNIFWPTSESITIFQGEEMGKRSKIRVLFPPTSAEGLRVHGSVHEILS